jgi:phosphotransferase system  glucose/maltose/N-acetylglucosamine-specific IIC component
MSAAFFWSASLVNLVFKLYVQSAPDFIVAQVSIDVLSQAMQLLGLSILTYGVFSYWRLTRNVRVPKHERSEKHKERQILTEDDSVTVEQVSEQAILRAVFVL